MRNILLRFSAVGDAYQFDVLDDPFGKTAMSVFTYLQGKVAGLNITIRQAWAVLRL